MYGFFYVVAGLLVFLVVVCISKSVVSGKME